jgi:hypothetical protein
MRAFEKLRRGSRAGLVAVGAMAVSAGAFAQSSGTTTPTFDDTGLLAALNGLSPIQHDVGIAVLSLIVVSFGFGIVRRMVTR